MSKYIIGLDENTVKAVQTIGILPHGAIHTHTIDVEDLEELNSDYINEHFGDLQDVAYKRGFEDGKASDDKGCEGCAYVGLKESDVPCVRCSKCYTNQYRAKMKDDEINVGDEVKWNAELIVVTCSYMDGGFNWCDGIRKDGKVFHVLRKNVIKTGRHYDARFVEEK